MTDATYRKADSGELRTQSSRKNFVLTPLAAAVIAALSPAGLTFAQEDAARIDEVIVTATKRELSLQDVPHSIDVLSSLELTRMGARDLEATLKALPSMHLTSLTPGQNSLVVRGISTGAYEYRTEAQVAVYLDEQPMTFISQQVSFRNIDMQRIEHLPGPQGTLFGASSQTGTIRFITNKPDATGFSGQVEARGATTSGGEPSYEWSGIVNIPLVNDVLAIRAVGYSSLDGGYVDNVFGESFTGNYDNADLVEDDFNEYEVEGGRLHVLWNMGDRWSTLITAVAENTTADGVWDSDASLGDYKVSRFEEEIRTDDWYSTSVTLNGDLGFAELSFNATKLDRDITYEYDNMTYSQFKDAYWGGGLYDQWVPPPFPPGPPASNPYNNYPLYDTEYNRAIIFNDQYQERDSMELRLTSTGDSRFQWMVGGYFEDIVDFWYYGTKVDDLVNTAAWTYALYLADYYSYNPGQVSPLPETDVGYSNTLDRQVKQTAAFSELSYDLTDSWTVHGGIRWAEFDRDVFSRFAFPEGLVTYPDRADGDGTFRGVGKIDDTIYKIGLRYNIDDDRMLYGLYSQGFRLGGVNSQRAANTGRVPLEYDGDFLDNYEFGIKSQWFDGRLTINADAFLMEWSDYMWGATFDQWWLRGTVNAGDVRTTGLELQAAWRVTEHLTLSANLFLADPEFKDNWCNDYVDGIYQGCVIDENGDVVGGSTGDLSNIVAGMTMPNSAKKKAHASIYYEVPDILGGNLWLYYDIAYSDAVWNNTFNVRNNNTNGIAPSWTYSSFSAGLQLPNQFDVEINVRNLFDAKGFSYMATWEANEADLFNDPRYHQIRAQDRPRTVWLTLRKGFGGT